MRALLFALLLVAVPAAVGLAAAPDAGAGAGDRPERPVRTRIVPFEQVPEPIRDRLRYESQLVSARDDASAGLRRQLELARWKLGILALVLVLVAPPVVARLRSRSARRVRRALLFGLALLSIAAYYRFSFSDRIQHDMQIKDVYHYYIGSKYFAEIGYAGLYECTLAAASEREQWWVGELDYVRDLTTMLPAHASQMIERGVSQCRARFSEARWAAFLHDHRFFFVRLQGPVWQRILMDHGYNPSPVWTLLARPVASLSPAGGLLVLVHLDTLLVLAALGAMGWAFGFDTLCLAAIVWGTGFPWRYTWVGDAFLRQIWFASAVIGICLLRRGGRWLGAAGGATLALSALVRLFPGVFLAGYGVHALRATWRERRVPRAALGVFAGAAASSAILIGASVATSERGWDDFVAFERNTANYRDLVSVNMAGLPALLWRIDGTTDLQWNGEFDGPPPIGQTTADVLRVVLSLGLLALFWRAIRDAEAWEAAAAAFTWIPVLAAPPGYYLEFVVLAAPLAIRWPRVAPWLIAAGAAWLVNGLFWRSLGDQYTVVSLVAVALSVAVLSTMCGRPVDASRDET